jgi:hypothetical protein
MNTAPAVIKEWTSTGHAPYVEFQSITKSSEISLVIDHTTSQQDAYAGIVQTQSSQKRS